MTIDALTFDRPDAELLELSRQGDRDAFGMLVRRYQTAACSQAYSMLGDLARSEDVAQEAFLAAWKDLGKLQDRDKFKPWLRGIVRNVALAGVRHKRRQVAAASFDEQPGRDPTPEESAMSREEQALVWTALGEIPDTYREPLILFYREEQSVAAVAGSLDLSEDAVKQRLSRGRALLREQLAEKIERVLRRSKPGPIFTAAVLGALPGLVTGTAAAATVTAAGKASAAPVAKAAISAAGLGMLSGLLGGIGGASVAAWFQSQTSRYQAQRDHLRRSMARFVIWTAVFLSPYLAIEAGWWRLNRERPHLAAVLCVGWMTVYFVVLTVWSIRTGNRARAILKEQIAAGAPALPETAIGRWLTRWEGRRWQSRLKLFGLPIIDVNFSDLRTLPDDTTPSTWRSRSRARGWIALGDCAQGVLLSVGSIAIGGVAVGGVCIGILPIGGLAVGLLPVGGMAAGVFPFGGAAVGVGAIGGMALGWWAVGGLAVAFRAANAGQGVAWAHDFATGGQSALATHANDAAAVEFMQGNRFFRYADYVMEHVIPVMGRPWFPPALLGGTVLLVFGLLMLGYRRKPRPAK